MFPVSRIVYTPVSPGGGGGGSTSTPPVTVVNGITLDDLNNKLANYVKGDGSIPANTGPVLSDLVPTEDRIKKLITGGGLFRNVYVEMTEDGTSTRDHWTSFVVFRTPPGNVPQSFYLDAPFSIEEYTEKWRPSGVAMWNGSNGLAAGSWTILMNANPGSNVTIRFAWNTGWEWRGTRSDGSALGASGVSGPPDDILAPGRMAIVVYLGAEIPTFFYVVL